MESFLECSIIAFRAAVSIRDSLRSFLRSKGRLVDLPGGEVDGDDDFPRSFLCF